MYFYEWTGENHFFSLTCIPEGVTYPQSSAWESILWTHIFHIFTDYSVKLDFLSSGWKQHQMRFLFLSNVHVQYHMQLYYPCSSSSHYTSALMYRCTYCWMLCFRDLIIEFYDTQFARCAMCPLSYVLPWVTGNYSALKPKKAVAAYLKSKQLSFFWLCTAALYTHQFHT